MSGTHLYYNGVLLRNCLTKSWRQEIVKDESGTDVLYSKVRLTVESELVTLLQFSGPLQSVTPPGGLLAPQSSIAIPPVNGETVVDRWQEVQWRLQEHRKDFWFALNGVTAKPKTPNEIPDSKPDNKSSYRIVLAATGLSVEDLDKFKTNPAATIGFIDGFSVPNDGGPVTNIERHRVIDLNNGPKPIDVQVDRVVGGHALRVSFTIEVCRCFCDPNDNASVPTDPYKIKPAIDSSKVKGVLSNRWSLTESLDKEWKTQHDIEGKLVVSDRRYKPMAMKMLVHPLLFPYARLESRSFTTDRTGLALAYRFTIKETGPAAPPGIVDWDGTYTERSMNGGKKLADISVRVTGQVNPVNAEPGLPVDDPKIHTTHKSYLVAMAYRIASSRIRFATKMNPIPGSEPDMITVTDAVVTERMKEPIIELRLSVLYADKENGKLVSDKFGLRLKNMGASFEDVIKKYDPQWWQLPGDNPWDTKSEEAYADRYGSYYDCYFQIPCAEWHTMPRGAMPPKTVARDVPPAPAGGPAPAAAVTRNASLSESPTIVLDPDLRAELFDANDPPPGQPVSSDRHGWNDSQVEFAYIQADIDTKYRLSSGNIQLPLSKPRPYSSSNQLLTGATSTVVKLHAGLCQRVITMVATREGKPPQVPQPKATLKTGSTLETYLDGHVITNPPKLTKDGQKYIHSVQVQWIYAVSRLPTEQADVFRAASNPMDKTKPEDNVLKVSDFFNSNVVESERL